MVGPLTGPGLLGLTRLTAGSSSKFPAFAQLRRRVSSFPPSDQTSANSPSPSLHHRPAVEEPTHRPSSEANLSLLFSRQFLRHSLAGTLSKVCGGASVRASTSLSVGLALHSRHGKSEGDGRADLRRPVGRRLGLFRNGHHTRPPPGQQRSYGRHQHHIRRPRAIPAYSIIFE